MFLIFGIIIFFKLHTSMIESIDQTLLKGGQILVDELSEYKLKDKNNLQSLYVSDSDGEEIFVDELDEEAKEIFFVNVAYIQLTTCHDKSQRSPEFITKTANLKDKTLPFSQKTCEKILQDSSHSIETIEGFFPFSIRLISMKAYDYNKIPYILQIAISIQEEQTFFKNILLFVCLLFPFILIILSMTGFFFMKKVFSPIQKILDLTTNITAQDLSQRLDIVDSDDEIGELVETLNDMIGRLESSFLQIKQFSEDVAHELKTPLAKLKCNAEISIRKERTKDDYQNVIISIIKDTNALEQITNDLLFLSKMDSQHFPQSFESLSLHEMVLSVFEETHQLAHKKNIKFDFGRIDHVEIYTDKGLIRTMLTNLIYNAIKYTESGGTIIIDLQKQNKNAELTITDNGVGISKKDLPYIFDRFFRIDPSRSLETGGSGLGLAIVKKIIQFLDGEISVKSSLGKGSSFSIILPRVK